MQNFMEKWIEKWPEPVWAEILHVVLKDFSKIKILITIFDLGPLKGTLFNDPRWKYALNLSIRFQIIFFLVQHKGHWPRNIFCEEITHLSFLNTEQRSLEVAM